MKMLENLQDDFDFNYKTLKSAGGKNRTLQGGVSSEHGAEGFLHVLLRARVCNLNFACGCFNAVIWL